MKRDHFDDVKHDNWSLKQFFFKFPDILSNYSIQNKISEQDVNMPIALPSCWNDF